MIGFHDSTLTGFVRDGNDVLLQIEDVTIDDEKGLRQEQGVLHICDVSQLTENGRLVQLPSYRFEFGNVLGLHVRERPIRLLVEWESFSPRESQFAEYAITGSEATWRPGEQVASLVAPQAP